MGGEEMSNDMRSAAQTGVKAAQAAKTVAKAAGHAAAGNYVGAAATVAKNSSASKIVAGMAIFLAFMVFATTFLVPLMIYETLAGYITELQDRWEDYKEQGGGKFAGAYMATVRVIADETVELGHKIFNFIRHIMQQLARLVKQVGNGVNSKWSSGAKAIDDKPTTSDQPNGDDDRRVLEDTKQTADTYSRKLYTMKKLFQRREKEIAKDILKISDFAHASGTSGTEEYDKTGQGEAGSDSWIYRGFGSIFMQTYPQGWQPYDDGVSETATIYIDHYRAGEASQGTGTVYVAATETVPVVKWVQYVYGGVTVYIRKKTIEPMQALKLLCLYEMLMTDTPDDVSMAGFTSWVGVDNSINYIEYPIGDSTYQRQAGNGPTPFYARKGGFMPKYLTLEEQESKYRTEDTHEPGLIGWLKQLFKKNVERNKYDQYKVAPVDLMIKIDAPHLGQCAGQESAPFFVSEHVDYTSEYQIVDDYWDSYPVFDYADFLDAELYSWLYDYPSPDPSDFWHDEPYIEYVYDTVSHATQLNKYYEITVTYNYPISISVRDVDEILKYAGFYEGSILNKKLDINPLEIFDDYDYGNYDPNDPDTYYHEGYYGGGGSFFAPPSSGANVTTAQVIDWLKKNTDWGDAMICAILVNIGHESGFNTGAYGDANCGGAVGLFQWNDRKWNLKAFAEGQGKEYTDFEVEMEFMLYECQTSEAGQMAIEVNRYLHSNNYNDVADASVAWARDWERCANPNRSCEEDYQYYWDELQNYYRSNEVDAIAH